MIFDFSEVVDGEEFTDLNCQEVARLISEDKLNVSSEEKVLKYVGTFDFKRLYSIFIKIDQVYEAVMRWVDGDSVNRISELPIVMENVRLPLISKEYLLQHVEPNAFMRSNVQCKLRFLNSLIL